jgi:hypothetical protein
MILPDLSHLVLKPIFEVRERFERRIDKDFNRTASDNKSDLLSRFRAGVSFSQGKTQGQLVYQYGHDELWSEPTNMATWRSDVLLAYVTTPFEGMKVTLGRQRLKVGSERLLGQAEFNNVTNSWDGAKISRGNLDLFGGKLGVTSTPDERLSLFGGVLSEGKTTQTLVAYKHDGRAAGIDETTISQQATIGFGRRLKLDAEAAIQFGHRGGQKKLAGAADAIVTYETTSKISLGGQLSVASGGGSGDTNRTFDQLYPSGHDRHGLMDMSGWQNIRDLGLWIQYTPDKATKYKLQYHGLGLDSAYDAWYGSNGKKNGSYVSATGTHGRDVGNEIDLVVDRKMNAHQALSIGLGAFLPGKFIRSFSGDAKDEVYGFVQWNYKF